VAGTICWPEDKAEKEHVTMEWYLRIRTPNLVFSPLFWPIVYFFVLVSCNQVSAWTGLVINTPDGDMLTVRKSGRGQVKIRLYGIDCPEKGQPYANDARRFAAGMVLRKAVTVKELTRDRGGHTVALVFKGSRCLNEEIVKAGYAWIDRRRCQQRQPCSRWLRLEADARKKKKGLWKGNSPEPPWEWRNSRK